ncbi:MAG: hypothetical protein L0H23_08225, partial [Luteimonas sp.]|nr:hypothetical protein [Luteimonas sp.]
MPSAAPPDAAAPAGTDDEAAWLQLARDTLAQADAALAARFDRGEAVDRLVATRARSVDGLIRDAWSRCVPGDAQLALFALG